MTDYQAVSDEVNQNHGERKAAFSIFSDWLSRNDSYFARGVLHYLKGFFYCHIWLYMGMADIRRRYRRSFLGPFWVTLSLAIFVGSMGVIFPILWHTDVKTYLPFFASGFVIWTFFSTMIIESCGTFLDASGLIKQIPLPYVIYSNVVVTRNLLIMLHHSVVYFLIVFMFNVPINLNTLLIIPALLLLCFTGSWVSLLLGLLSLRYRDVRQIVVSVLQVTMFITPIFWAPAQLGSSLKAQLIVNLNPLYHFVEIARAPLLGQQATWLDWGFAVLFSLLGWLFTMRIFGKYYRHLVFWL